MRILFALPGLHRFNRGAEVAFISIAKELVALGETVTLIGSGYPMEGDNYRFSHAASIERRHFESFPSAPGLRNEFAYEDLTFLPNLLLKYRPGDYDVTLTCSFPFTHFALRRPILRGRRPAHVFVTQNGDWPAYANNSENRFFHCEGLICINPDYYERNRGRWRSRLIPNGVDINRFMPGPSQRTKFGIPNHRFVVLMVSALDPTKRVAAGIEAVSRIKDAHLVVAGDGALRNSIDKLADEKLPNRFTRLTIKPDQMPDLYRSADAFLHLSQVESFGNVYLEAIATGLPVVGFDSARTRWIVGENEYLVPSEEPTFIVTQLGRARAEGSDFKRNRIERARHFAWGKIAADYQSFLLEVTNSS